MSFRLFYVPATARFRQSRKNFTKKKTFASMIFLFLMVAQGRLYGTVMNQLIYCDLQSIVQAAKPLNLTQCYNGLLP